MRSVALKRILSQLFIIPEHRFVSKLSGPMDVRWENGRLALNSLNANYSYNHLHKVMQVGLSKVLEQPLPAGSILNLGMGAGSTISILREEFHLDTPIVSVEYDSQIIAIAKQYFELDRFKGNSIHCTDAFDFVMRSNDRYALIIIDLFRDKQVDERFLSEEFVRKCTSLLMAEGVILFNYIGGERHPAEDLLPGKNIAVLPIEENRLLIYRNTDRS